MLVYMSIEVAMKFLLIINISPLDSCTYLGLDQGGQPCQVYVIVNSRSGSCQYFCHLQFCGFSGGARRGGGEYTDEN